MIKLKTIKRLFPMIIALLACLFGIWFTTILTVFKAETVSSIPDELAITESSKSMDPVETIMSSEPEIFEELEDFFEPSATPESSEPPAPVLLDIPLMFKHLVFDARKNFETKSAFIEEINYGILQLEDALASDDFTEAARESMYLELTRLQELRVKVDSEITHTIVGMTPDDEYYYVNRVWEYFTQRRYSEVVTSAIIGNMMIETSGGTLKLNPMIYDKTLSYYGLCQWSLKYRPEVANMSFEDQLVYLDNDMAKEFKTFGKCYKKGFTYEDFLAMEDPAEAALAFAKVYERCGRGSYKLRKSAAITAYEYFTNNK